MKKLYILFLFLIVIFQVNARVLAPDPNAFITTWKTDNISTGSSNSTSINIPTTGGGYSYDIDWNNDGIYDQFGVTGNATHDYGIAGNYQVAIRGAFPRIYFNGVGDRLKILSIDQWGSINWQSMEYAFWRCSNLNGNATDVPNLTAVTNMRSMFAEAFSFNQNISAWNVENITDMATMFYFARAFNQNIGNWNVGNVTNMNSMFAGATAFNQDIGNWNVRSVTNMGAMFSGGSFNQDIGAWDVKNVTNMSGMFSGAISFNQNIGNWNVSNVNDMRYMFNTAISFNQDIGTWDISNVISMQYMFYEATSFNQAIGAWGAKFATSVLLDEMFRNCGINVANYDATLTGFNAGTVRGRSLGASGMMYCASAADRANLITAKGWTITGDVLSAACVPEIDIKGNSQSIANNDTTPTPTDYTDFGDINVPAGSVTRTFTIENTGGGVLNLTGTPLVIISGTNAADFTVTALPASTVAAAGTTTFQITFDPSAHGVRNAVISIANNDPDENPYKFALQGMGCGISISADTATNPSTCSAADGSIAFTSVNLPDGTYPLTFTPTGAGATSSPQNITVLANAFLLSGLSAGTYENFSVSDGACTGSTAASKVLTDPTTIGGTVSGGTTIASGDNSGVLTLSGQTGSVVKWQSAESPFTSWTDIAHTGATYTSRALTQTTQFRAVVKNGNCPEENAAPTTVTINPASVGGTVSGGTTICPGSSSAVLTLSGYTGDIVKWQSAESPFKNWTDITHTAATYTSGSLTQTTQFRAVVKNGILISDNAVATTVTVSDTNAPVADATTLPTINAQCSVASITAPTATDNCKGTITGTTTTTFPITSSTTVEWIYSDGINSSKQYQLVTIADTTNPVVTCMGNQILSCGERTVPDYRGSVAVSDNCDPSVTVTQSPAPGTSFSGEITVEITAKDKSGNTSKCDFKVFEKLVLADAGSDLYIKEGETIQLEAIATEAGSFKWNAAAGLSNLLIANPFANPSETTTYTVVFTSTEGCLAEDSITVFVEPDLKDDTKYGFSPNNDGINDFWEIDTIEKYPDNEVFIYNRWGDLVFQIKNYDNATHVFGGIANRKRNLGADVLPDGTYFFDIQIKGAHHLKKTKGFLVLKR